MTPKPDARFVPTQHEFDAWCEHPVTQFVAAAFEQSAKAQREAWMQESWTNGKAAPEALQEYRVRADAYSVIFETELSQYVAILGLTDAFKEGKGRTIPRSSRRRASGSDPSA